MLKTSNDFIRYRFYREHKYLSHIFANLEQFIAKTDFRNNEEVHEISKQLESLETMMEGHAEHENSKIHTLLRQKNSSVHLQIEAEHKEHDKQYKDFKKQLNQILTISDNNKKLNLGYDFFLQFRLFISDNLKHFHEEETKIMPELQKLYTDEELRKVEFDTYSLMTSEHMVHMMEVLSPHMNPSDQTFFLMEMKESEPKKFEKAWGLLKQKFPHIQI